MARTRVGDRSFDERLEVPCTLGEAVARLRCQRGQSLREFAIVLRTTSQHLSDVEHGKRYLSPERAATWAGYLGESREAFVRLALQRYLDEAGLKFRVNVEAA